ncbi:MAG: hypothetical protein Q9214_002296 [Letrouitia sp. 1 TL-2023]
MVRVFVTIKRGSLTLFQNERIMTLDLKPSIVGLTFDEVQGLRNLEDKVLSLGGYCKSALSIVQMLQSIPETKFEQEWTLQPYSDRLGDFVESLSALAARINNTIDLAAYFLDLKNQETAVEMNRAMSELTSKTNKDTTSVKWITYLTVIYLPASFVATLYGMNLFEFDENSRQLVIAKDFWIYLATWLPLTFFTFLGYLMLKGFHEPQEYRVISRLKGLRSKMRARRSRVKGDPHQDVELSSSISG